MKCQEAIPKIHEYLDGDLHGCALVDLNQHVALCPECSSRLAKLEKADALIHYLPKGKVPEDLTEKIMNAIPAFRQMKQRPWRQWVKRHPAASAASVFVIVMMCSFLSLWYQDAELSVQGADLDKVIIEGDLVLVPEGQTLEGDLLVENGKVQIDGKVNGNITVIDGSVNLASTAYISGKVTKVNQVLDWIWYKINEIFSGLTVLPN